MSGRTLRGSERFLLSAQAKSEAAQARSYNERLIDRANAEVSIFSVLNDYFGLHLPREGQSFKSHCPFGWEHPDGGMDKGFRTYPGTNSSMCFVQHGYMPPVRLIALKEGESSVRAAKRLLRDYGILAPEHWRKRFNGLLMAAEARSTRIGSPQDAVEALNMALRRNPDYQRRQYDPDVMEALGICLEALDEAVASGEAERIREWLTKAKAAMQKVIGRKQ